MSKCCVCARGGGGGGERLVQQKKIREIIKLFLFHLYFKGEHDGRRKRNPSLSNAPQRFAGVNNNIISTVICPLSHFFFSPSNNSEFVGYTSIFPCENNPPPPPSIMHGFVRQPRQRERLSRENCFTRVGPGLTLPHVFLLTPDPVGT